MQSRVLNGVFGGCLQQGSHGPRQGDVWVGGDPRASGMHGAIRGRSGESFHWPELHFVHITQASLHGLQQVPHAQRAVKGKSAELRKTAAGFMSAAQLAMTWCTSSLSCMQAVHPGLATTVHSDVLSHASNGHTEPPHINAASSFPSLDAANDLYSSFEPIMGARVLELAHIRLPQ